MGGKWIEVWGATNGEDVPRRVKGLMDYRESQQNGSREEMLEGGGGVGEEKQCIKAKNEKVK